MKPVFENVSRPAPVVPHNHNVLVHGNFDWSKSGK